ncbi:MAG: hypothetical protein GWP39_05735 [Planctomycetia bacterium]|nr:hypothetical protein [Planctomycetia bacterium]
MKRLTLTLLCLVGTFSYGQVAPPLSSPLSPPPPEQQEAPAGHFKSQRIALEARCSGGQTSQPDQAQRPLAGSSAKDLQSAFLDGVAATGGGSTAGPTSGPVGPCTSAEFAAATGAAFVELVATSADDCLEQLWNFDGDVETAISPANILLIAAAIDLEALDLLINVDRLRRMTYFYQIAFFHEFYQSSVNYDDPTIEAAQLAMVTVGQQPELIVVDPPVDLLSQWLVSIDSTNASIQLLGQLEAVLQRYNSDSAHESVYQERLMAYRCLFTLARQIGNENNINGSNSPWYSAVPASLVSEIATIALDATYTEDSEYVVLNALWVLNRLGFLEPVTRDLAHDILTQAYNLHIPYSGPWLQAVTDLDFQFGGQLFGGGALDLDQIRIQVMALALPNEFSFDQGRLKFVTAIDLEVTEDLYAAMQEVEAQFFRKSGHLEPVVGDANEALTLVIYGSPQDYQTYQPFLYGLSTNNGGIFIESWGTLFTYDRTPAQSIYTLEELLRHEYTHYLDSRFLITGSFGQSGTLYEGDRMVWYNEGLAEYMVGATRLNGVLPRGVLLDRISSDSSRLTVADITSATYGSFNFYRYAGVYFEFLEEQHPDLLLALFEAVRGDDVVVLDGLYASMASDSQLQLGYDAFIDAQILAYQQGTELFAEEVATTATPQILVDNNANQVLATLQSILPGGGQFRVWPHRFQYSYSQTTPLSGQPIEVYRQNTDQELDGLLTTLTPLQDNMTSAVSWFGETTISGDLATSTVIFEGPYEATAADVVAPAAPTGVSAQSGSGTVSLTWNPSPEVDWSAYHVYRSEIAGGPYERLTLMTLWENEFIDTDAGMGQLYYVITAIDASGNESTESTEVVVESTIDILVINGHYDSAGPGYYTSYLNSLDTLGLGYQAWDPFIDGPVTTELLALYSEGVVMWPIGYFSTNFPDQLGAARQALLMEYLQSGGNLVLSGAFATAYLDDTPLFTNYLFLQHEQWSMDLPGLIGEAGDPVGDSLSLQSSNGVYQSELTAFPPAQKAIAYDPVSGSGTLQGGGAAVVTVDLDHKAAVLSFPLSGLIAADRIELLGRLVEWMLPPSSCADPFVRGDTNGSGSIDIADAVFLLDYLFAGGVSPSPEASGDANNDAGLDISDAIFLLTFLFDSGASPAAPYPDAGCP